MLIDSLVPVVREIAELLPTLENQQDRRELLERLVAARDEVSGIGWGYGDFMDDVVTDLAEKLA